MRLGRRRKDAARGERGAAALLPRHGNIETPASFNSRAEYRKSLAHGIAAHFDTMPVMDERIENAVSGCGIADLFVPAGNRQLQTSESSSGPDNDLRRFSKSAARFQQAEPSPSHRLPAHGCGSDGSANCASCRLRAIAGSRKSVAARRYSAEYGERWGVRISHALVISRLQRSRCC